MKTNERIFCVEAFEGNEPLLRAVEGLYNSTQHPSERIPWGWIARTLKGRAAWRPGATGHHLITAVPEEAVTDPAKLAGFAYGTFLPGFGGYLSYLGVSEVYRKRGVGTRLMLQMTKLLDADAGTVDEPLPFVVWESKRPCKYAPSADHRLWEARMRLFERVGGLWIDGLDLFTPNYDNNDTSHESAPVVLQLFVCPVDRSLEGFTPNALRNIALGLLHRVYRLHADDPLVTRTRTHAKNVRLRKPTEATTLATSGVA